MRCRHMAWIATNELTAAAVNENDLVMEFFDIAKNRVREAMRMPSLSKVPKGIATNPQPTAAIGLDHASLPETIRKTRIAEGNNHNVSPSSI